MSEFEPIPGPGGSTTQDIVGDDQRKLEVLQKIGYADPTVGVRPKDPGSDQGRARHLADWRAHLQSEHGGHSQRAAKAAMACNAIEAGLKELAALGHRFMLVMAEDEPTIEWPKMFYSSDGRTLVVHSPEAAEELSEQWSDRLPGAPTPEEVQARKNDPVAATPGGPPPVVFLDEHGKLTSEGAKQSFAKPPGIITDQPTIQPETESHSDASLDLNQE